MQYLITKTIKFLIVLRIYPLILFLNLIKFKKRTNKKWVFARVACLGNDIINLLDIDYEIYNIQKGRIDFLLNSILKRKSDINPNFRILQFIKRDDIKHLVLNQYYLNFKGKNQPEFLIMDSYSELTDQKFISPSNNRNYFFANYSDIDSDNYMKCDGLIATDESLEILYQKFFQEFRKLY